MLLTVMLSAGGLTTTINITTRCCWQMLSTPPPLGVLTSANITSIDTISIKIRVNIIGWRYQTPPLLTSPAIINGPECCESARSTSSAYIQHPQQLSISVKTPERVRLQNPRQ